VIHYHGGPVTPRTELAKLAGRHFCVSYATGRHEAGICHEIGQSVMLDNGAYSLWKSGKPTDWPGYYRWCETWLEHWSTWAVIPDVIGGTEAENDALIDEWQFGTRGAPVWHMHETIDRLLRLAEQWPRVCIGSSGIYKIRSPQWWPRMTAAMDALCGNGPPPCALHMLKGLALAGGPFPLASADSTAIARNHMGGHQGYWDPRPRPKRDVVKMADYLDARQCPARWSLSHEQLEMGAA
jgi:hypothetical protein